MKKHQWWHARLPLGLSLLVVLTLVAVFGMGQPRTYAQGNNDLPAWGQVASPNAGFHPFNTLNDVIMLSPTDVWAAGVWGDMYTYPFIVTPMIQHWNGTRWTRATLPENLPNSALEGIDASSSDNVWAVGNYNDPVALRYDGTTWSDQTPPKGSYNWLNLTDVAVLAPNDVWVTGKGQINYTQNFVLFLHWDGTTWSDHSLAFSYGQVGEINEIAAIAPNDIWMVGNGNTSFHQIYHFDGNTWQAVTDPIFAQFDEVNDLTTLPTGEVWIGGHDSDYNKQIAYFNGTAWSLLPTPPGGGYLYGDMVIEAIAPQTILAAKFYSFNGQNDTIIWQWDGTTWSISTLVETGTTLFLEGLAGTETTRWVVGRDFDNGTLTQQWTNNEWRAVASDNGGTGDNQLTAVDGTGSNDIWATDNVGEQAVVLHWDGSLWEITETPSITSGLTLEGVDALTPNDVWSVGYTNVDNGLNFQTVILRWNGSQWNRVASPNPAGTEVDQLHDVVALNANEAWAVGAFDGTGDKALILKWDGVSWQDVPNSCGYGLASITAIAPNDLWAVGEYTACHYDGSTWTTVELPSDLDGVRFNGVDGVTTNDVWAVGTLTTCGPQSCSSSATAAHWDGSAWTRAPLPGVAMEDVVTLAPNNAYAVGTYSLGTTIAHWDGTTWTEVPAPDPETGGELQGIYAAAPDSLWAVGSFYDSDNDLRTLVLNAPSATQGAAYGTLGYGGATLLWLGPVNGSTTSNALGDYDAAGLPTGTYTFVATGDGCPVQQSTVYITAGAFVRQDFDLCGTAPTQVPSPTATIAGATMTPTSLPSTATPSAVPPTATATPDMPNPSATPSATLSPTVPTSTPTETAPTPPILFEPASVEGSQNSGMSRDYEVQMRNLDTNPLIWSSYTAVTSCLTPTALPWVTVAPNAGTVAPSEEITVMITVDTTGMTVGSYSGYVCILDSAGMVKPLPIKVNVVAGAGSMLYLPMIQRPY